MDKTVVIIGFDAELDDIADELKSRFSLSKVDIIKAVNELPADDRRDLYIVDDNYCTPSDKNTAWQPFVQAIRNRYPEAKILLMSVYPDDEPLAEQMHIAFHEFGTPYEPYLALMQQLLS